MKFFASIAAIVSCASFVSLASSQETEKPIEVTAYEDCAVRVFEESSKVSDVFAQCEAEMERYLALQDARAREKVKQRIMAETQRHLRASNGSEQESAEN